MLLFVLLGLLVGQWLVWCADRLPAGRSLGKVWGCPACEAGSDKRETLRVSRNPKGLSAKTDAKEDMARARPSASMVGRWLVALGWRRCPDCDNSGGIRWRSLITIAITAAGFGYIWSRYAATRDLVPFAAYWAIFILIFLIDLEHRLILNVVIYPAIVLGVAGAFITTGPGIARALLGGVVGFVFVYLVYLLGAVFARIMARRRGRPIDEVAFGAGDVKLAVFIGLVIGLPGVIFALVIGMLLGGLTAAAYLLWEAGVRRRYVAFTAIPYGPFLVAGALTMLFYGEPIMRWYLSAYS